MALPNEHNQGLKDDWLQVRERTKGMQQDQSINQMIPWITTNKDILGNFIKSTLQKYSLNTYHDS